MIDATPAGAIHTEAVGDDKALLTYADGRVAFQHTCDRGHRGTIVCAPLLQLGNGHEITRSEGPGSTVRASILCDDCGTHGWVTDGKWHE